MKKYEELSKEDKKMMTNVIIEFVKIYIDKSFNTGKETVKTKLSTLKKSK